VIVIPPTAVAFAAVVALVAVAALPVVFWFQMGTDPVKPEYGTEVATMVPDPVAASDAPVPTTIAAAVLVPEVSALKLVAAVAEAFNVPLDMLRLVPSVKGTTDEPDAA
jgi:hypothetical protein